VNSTTTFAKHPNTSMGTTVRVVVQFRRVLNVTFALHVKYYAVKSVKVLVVHVIMLYKSPIRKKKLNRCEYQ